MKRPQSKDQPWQYDWKNPQWHTAAFGGQKSQSSSPLPNEKAEASGNALTTGTCSAMVSYHELPRSIRQQIDQDNAHRFQASAQQAASNPAAATSTTATAAAAATTTINAPKMPPSQLEEGNNNNNTSSSNNNNSNNNYIASNSHHIILQMSLQASPRNKATTATTSPSKLSTSVALEIFTLPTTSSSLPAPDTNSISTTTLKSIYQKTLLWPCAVGPSNQNRNKQDPYQKHNLFQRLFPWQLEQSEPAERTGSSQDATSSTTSEGIVSASLIRMPKLSLENQDTVDLASAMEVVEFLSLGMPTTQPESAVKAPAANPNEEIDQGAHVDHGRSKKQMTTQGTNRRLRTDHRDDDQEQALRWVCISNDGKAYFYDPWQFIDLQGKYDASKTDGSVKPHDDDDDDDDGFSNGLASLLFGAELDKRLKESILPLSRPIVTIPLTVVDKHPSKKKRKPRETGLLQNEDKTAEKKSLLAKLIDWNPSVVEPSSLRYMSKHNIPQHVEQIGDYLVVAGAGFRDNYRHRGRTRRDAESSSVAALSAVQSQDSANWWDEDADLQHDANHETFKDDHKDDYGYDYRIRSPQRGGFVTFISLRQMSEAKTVFLPFEPKQISKFQIYGHLFCLVVGRESAVAIPTTTFWTPEPTDATASPPSLPPEAAAAAAMDSKAPRNEPHISPPMTTPSRNFTSTYIRRFQLLPVDIPVGEVSGSLIGASSSASTVPPTLLLAYTEVTKMANVDRPTDVLIMQRGINSIGVINRSGSCLSDYRSRISSVLPGRESVKTTSNPALSESRVAGTDTLIGLKTEHALGHVARLMLESKESVDDLWSYEGQGWCVVGTKQRTHFILWEGSNQSRGAQMVAEINATIAAPNVGCVSTIQPLPVSRLCPPSRDGRFGTGSHYASAVSLAGLTFLNDSILDASTRRDSLNYSAVSNQAPYYPTVPEPKNVKKDIPSHIDTSEAADLEKVDELVAEALESISGLSFRDDRILPPRMRVSFNSTTTSPGRHQRLSHHEKSSRLLQQCSSWIQLENNVESRAPLIGQVPTVFLSGLNGSSNSQILTLRALVLENGPASPFQQVLSWLCNQRDYFTAASIALDLLRDADTLYDLWRNAEKIDEEDEKDKLQGLLDGIIPITISDFSPSDDDGGESQMDTRGNDDGSIQTQLADMTVACLTKGGYPMSNSLRRFLRINTQYDASRASLILVARTAAVVSDDPTAVREVMQSELPQGQFDTMLWPVHCMLEIGVSRQYLPTTMMLLNGTIPDELRSRRTDGSSVTNQGSLRLAKALVQLIVSSSEDGPKELLDLVDDYSRCRFWQSLDSPTRLEFAVIDVDGKCPLLRQSEVREWCRAEVHVILKQEGMAKSNVFEAMPTMWLQKLCQATLRNAGCDTDYLTVDISAKERNDPYVTLSETTLPFDAAKQMLESMGRESQEIREALIPARGLGGIDFDLAIPCLLLLYMRQENWCDGPVIPTHRLLDSLCRLAGMHQSEPSVFDFDGTTAMKQCTLAGNVRAGGYLVGGKNGFVLLCCDILMNGIGMDMESAESFLLCDQLQTDVLERWTRQNQGKNGTASNEFILEPLHFELLQLLDEHVMSIRTFGQFETIHLRGRVDPIFASSCIFKCWLLLTSSSGAKSTSTPWIVSWLRRRLEITDGKASKRRLVSAALTRALVWASPNTRENVSFCTPEDPSHLLAYALGMEPKFLCELAISCNGLVEAIPYPTAKDMMTRSEVSTAH